MREVTGLLTDLSGHVGARSTVGPAPCRSPGRVDACREKRSLNHSRLWEFPRTPESPGRARKLARICLAGWGIGGEPADAVELIVSELITNSVTHTRSARVWFGLALTDSTIAIEVRDEGPGGGGSLEPGGAADEDESGRGLFLVAHAASSWGRRRIEAGQAVWAHVDASGHGHVSCLRPG